jgi:hypothetical protein
LTSSGKPDTFVLLSEKEKKMTHFGTDVATRQSTPSEWLQVGRQIGELVNDWAGRSDLAVFIGPEASAPAPAIFNPASAEIEVNTESAFGAFILPEHITDIRTRDTQLEFAKATGAIFHEASHARFSAYSLPDASKVLTNEEFEALHLLEETRAEGWGLRVLPKNQVFLRACALEIVLGDAHEFEGLSNVRMASRLAGLTLARVDAGVLSEDDVEPAHLAIAGILGEEVIEKLRSVWVRFQAHADHTNAYPLYDLAREWVKIVNETSVEQGEPQPGDDKGEGEDGEGEGSGSGTGSAFGRLMDALADAIGNTAIAVSDQIADEQTAEEWASAVSRASQQTKVQNENKAEAKKVFVDGHRPGEEGCKSGSRLVEVRKPTADERISAVKVAQMLEKAKYRERSETEVKTVLPPGRLRTRALVQGQALKAKGVHTQVEAWRHTARKHTDDPTLTVGVMVDISGSMGGAMKPMATTAWVMSEAVRRVQGKSAMVYYGSDVFPTLKPGQHLTDVNVYSAPDGTEKFDKAFKALDGSLNLLYGTGARLLVVVSDGAYTSEEGDKAKKWIAECQRNGVGVLWLSYDYDHYARRYLNGTDGQFVRVDSDPTKTATLIGKACADALTAIGKRNA